MNDENIKQLLMALPPVVGIAPTAFPRVVMAEYLKNYSILCFKWRGETPLIKRDTDVFCIQERFPQLSVSKVNAKEMLSLPVVQNYLRKLGTPFLLIYKPSTGIEKLAGEFGWNLIANPYAVKDQYENKKSFREMLIESGVTAIPGETVKFDDLTQEAYHVMQKKYGERLVFQVAEMTAGGGTGTAFINSDEDYYSFVNRITEKRAKLTAIENVNITRFITAVPASIAACVTQNGVLTGRIQLQVQDIGEVRTLTEGSGLFSGHDWSFRQYDDVLQQQAKSMAKMFGEFIGKRGYKGIFGMDLLIEEQERKVYPVECNPRFTDAFPVLSMMHQSKGLLPMDVFHLLEHVGVNYKYDVDALSQQYDQPLEGAQIILETKTNGWTKATGEVKAGVYVFDGKSLVFVRGGYRYQDLNSDNEVLVTEGVPFVGTIYKPGARVVRLVFKKAILSQPKALTEEARNVIDLMYKKIALVEIPPQEEANED